MQLRKKDTAIPQMGEDILVDWVVDGAVDPVTGNPVVKQYKAHVQYIIPLPNSRRPDLAIAGLLYPANADFPSDISHTVYFQAKNKVKVLHGDADKTPTPWAFYEDDPDVRLSESDNDDVGAPLFEARSEVADCRQEIAELKEKLSSIQHQVHSIAVQDDVQAPALSAAQRVLKAVQLNLLIELGKPPRWASRKLKKRQTETQKASSTVGNLLRSFVKITVPCSYNTFQEILKKGAAHPATDRTPRVRYIPDYPKSARPLKSYHAVFLTFPQICTYIGIHNGTTRSQMLFSSRKGAAQILGTVGTVTTSEPFSDVYLTPGVSTVLEQKNAGAGKIVVSELHYGHTFVNKGGEYVVEREKFRNPFERIVRTWPKKMDPSVEDKEFPYCYFYLSWAALPSPHARFDSDIPFTMDPQGTLHVSMPVVGTKSEYQKEEFSELFTDTFVDVVVSNV